MVQTFLHQSATVWSLSITMFMRSL